MNNSSAMQRGTLSAINELAIVDIPITAQGNTRRARRYSAKPWKSHRRVYGSEHPNTPTYMSNLAATYGFRGKYDEAESLFKKALDISSRVVGPENPSTLGILPDFVFMYQQKGDYVLAATRAAQALWKAGGTLWGLDDLFDDLKARREKDQEDWKLFFRNGVTHPLCTLLHQDPFTYRAFSKPRGYAGDAAMMDYIYGMGEAASTYQQTTPLGREILQYMSGAPRRAVREIAADCCAISVKAWAMRRSTLLQSKTPPDCSGGALSTI